MRKKKTEKFNKEEFFSSSLAGDKSKLKKIFDNHPEAIFEENDQKQNIVHLLAMNGNVELLKWLFSSKYLIHDFDLNSKDSNGWTALHLAINERHFEVIQLLLEQDQINPSIATSELNTPLHYFVRLQFDEEKVTLGRNILSLFIKKGVDLNAVNNMGESPLFGACFRGPRSSVSFLIDNGANVNLKNKSGETPIHYAIRRGDVNILQALSSRSIPGPNVPAISIVDFNVKGLDGTPFEMAKMLNRDDLLSFLYDSINRQSLLLRLPNSVLILILSYLPLKKILDFCLVCKLFKRIAMENELWQKIFFTKFPNAAPSFPNNFYQSFKSSYMVNKNQLKKISSSSASKAKTLHYKKKSYKLASVIRIQALVRGRFARKKYLSLKKQHRQRSNIAREIYETEKSYVSSLNLLIKYFYEPLLQESKSSFPFITPAQLKEIFGEINVIRDMSSILEDSLKKKLDTWGPYQLIGEVFLKLAKFLKLYTDHINNASRSIETLNELITKNKNFAKWLQKATNNPELNKQDINSFLILPVQRIPRYELLLDQLKKNTWKDHPDYKNISDALREVKEAAQWVNEKKRDSDNMEKVNEIYSWFKLKDQKVPVIRRHIKDGPITEYTDEIHHSRHLFLFNDIFILAVSKKPKEFTIILQEDLIDMKIDSAHSAVLLSFKISNIKGDKSWIFCTTKEEELREWLYAFESAIKQSRTLAKKPKAYVQIDDLHVNVNKQKVSKPKSVEEELHNAVVDLRKKFALEKRRREELEAAICRSRISDSKLSPQVGANSLTDELDTSNFDQIKRELLRDIDKLEPSSFESLKKIIKNLIEEDPLICVRFNEKFKNESLSRSPSHSPVPAQRVSSLTHHSAPVFSTSYATKHNPRPLFMSVPVSSPPPPPNICYTYEELKDFIEKKSFPPEINASYIENYLSEGEFETLFGLTKNQFYSMPGWRQRDAKLAHKLF